MAKKEVKNNKDKTSFMKSFKAELKKVVWPTPKQLFNNTVAVLAIVLITTLIVFVLDFAFNAINEYGIDKVKTIVSNTTNETTDSDTESDETEVDSEEMVVDDEETSEDEDETTDETVETTETDTETENVVE